MTEQFQISLFGYSKKSVHLYLSEINEEFSQKLLEKEKENRDSIQALREEMELLREENERLLAERQEVAGALIDANAFASGLKAQAEEEDNIQRTKNAKLRQAEHRRIQVLSDHINQLRTKLRSMLSCMEEELEQYELLCKSINAEDGEISLTQEDSAEQEPMSE